MNFPAPSPKSILITGASSGIGEALALAYACPGRHLFICGRNQDRLEAVALACRNAGAQCETQVIDVSEREPLENWIKSCELKAPLDLVIANAGISSGTGGLGESDERVRDIFATNIDGVVNTVLPVIAPMKSRGGGHIAIVSSIASFCGYAPAPAYCASKAAERIWGDGLRRSLRGDGIFVSVICPGFVESRITDANRFSMPLLMTAQKAARIIVKGLARKKAHITFPWQTAFGSWMMGVLPPALSDFLLLTFRREI